MSHGVLIFSPLLWQPIEQCASSNIARFFLLLDHHEIDSESFLLLADSQWIFCFKGRKINRLAIGYKARSRDRELSQLPSQERKENKIRRFYCVNIVN